ncbi:MAG: phosphoribosylformylglycinamidine cyclo-ligase [Verrucomicrobium sp.]|nr:phosphoribosylformylglycinamidine cyclo-ligase [Verrucomicrobium sp.]
MKKKLYSRAGVDVDLGNRVKGGIGALVAAARRPEVLGSIGGFGGLFRAKFPKMKDPVLVGSIDGVGTKLKVAEMADRHDTIGEDLVNHCVNDIAVLGAEPLFFLDYIGTSKLEPKRFRQILTGLVRGCKGAGCALIGGETAQMPGLYHGKDYDLVGSIVGVVDRKKIVDGRSIRAGDALIGLPATGLHTNGYALARHILFDKLKLTLKSRLPGLKGTLGEALLAVHPNYLPVLRKTRRAVTVKGMAHITGGGLLDNLPRVLPKKVDARIDLGSWEIPPLFRFLVEKGKIAGEEPYQVFNMGIGMVLVVAEKDAAQAARLSGGRVIGRIVKGTGRVRLG